MKEAIIGGVATVAFLFGVAAGGGINELAENEPRIAGQAVPGEVSCFEDELIGFVARDTIACIHVDDVMKERS